MVTSSTTDPTAPDVAELGALREIVQFAAGASTWDELMQLIVDRSTGAMRTEVCSLYLVDRDGAGLTLAATNGVDREHIGVARPSAMGAWRRSRAWPAAAASSDTRTAPGGTSPDEETGMREAASWIAPIGRTTLPEASPPRADALLASLSP